MRWSGLMEGKIERNYCRVLIVSVEALFPDHDVGRARVFFFCRSRLGRRLSEAVCDLTEGIICT